MFGMFYYSYRTATDFLQEIGEFFGIAERELKLEAEEFNAFNGYHVIGGMHRNMRFLYKHIGQEF